jgi:UDP-glucuronate decarboxylase
VDSKTIAVAGGAGFLGSHVCARLADAGHLVVCLDDFSTGRLDNVSRLFSSGRLLLHEHDVLEPFPRGLPRFDEIYNFACPASPLQYRRDPVRTALISVRGALHCLERASADGARLFHASGSEVYGAPPRHPDDQDCFSSVDPIGPRACHDEGMRLAETLVSDYAHQNSLDCAIGRIFETYGPRMRPDHEGLASRLIVQALRGQDLTISGAGDQTCSLCFVDDLTDGVLRLMASSADASTPIDLGDPHETTLAALAALVLELTGSTSRIVYRLRVTDAVRRRPDITLARRTLGWFPKVPLREGLRRTVEDFARALGVNAAGPRRRPGTVIPFTAARGAPLAKASP